MNDKIRLTTLLAFTVSTFLVGCGGDDSASESTEPTSVTQEVAAPKAAIPVAQRLQALQHQHIYITACLHQSEKILPAWTSELVRLVLALRGAQTSGSVFVSIYESD